MVVTDLPAGRYLSAVGGVLLGKGGQTAAMLMRSRILSEARGEPVDVLTFDPSLRYDRIRHGLTEDGLLSHGMRLLNLFEHYREHPWGNPDGIGEQLEPVSGLEVRRVMHGDGTPWRTSYLDGSGSEVVYDFQRPDGSVYLRSAAFDAKQPATHAFHALMVGEGGEVIGPLDTLGDLYRRWITDLTATDPQAFVFIDSRFLLSIVAPIEVASIHLVYLLHGCHLPRPRLWSTPPRPDYAGALDRIGDVSAFVTLTQRQRTDIARGWGDRTNLAVVPHPAVPPAAVPANSTRDPRRVVVIGRLERVKRIEHALLVWGRVVQQLPDARLDIYGSGSQHERLQQIIDKKKLTGSVTLHGFNPQARDQLWNASAMLLTSRSEAYALVILESLARGCPVVSYDICYGPREQIDDGKTGFIVPDGDIAAAAERVVQLLTDQRLVKRMGRAGKRAAARHSQATYLANWARVLNDALARGPRRVRIQTVDLALRADATSRPNAVVVSGHLDVVAETTADPRSAVVSLSAVDRSTGAFAVLPLRLIRRDLHFDFSVIIDLQELEQNQGSPPGELQLRLAWENAFWHRSFSLDELHSRQWNVVDPLNQLTDPIA
jgi:poly(glycerol-phosphate) alpha-glucosyltransferase